MEKFKKKLKNDIIVGVVFCSLLVILQTLLWFFLPQTPNGVEKNFTAGFLVGLGTVCVVFIARNVSSLKNEDELKKLYIKETDERRKSINLSASRISFKISLVGLATAMIIAININKFIGFALLAAVLFIIAVNISTILYFNRKM